MYLDVVSLSTLAKTHYPSSSNTNFSACIQHIGENFEPWRNDIVSVMVYFHMYAGTKCNGKNVQRCVQNHCLFFVFILIDISFNDDFCQILWFFHLGGRVWSPGIWFIRICFYAFLCDKTKFNCKTSKYISIIQYSRSSLPILFFLDIFVHTELNFHSDI